MELFQLISFVVVVVVLEVYMDIKSCDFDVVDKMGFGCLRVFMSCMTSTEFVVLESNHKHTLKHSLRLMFMQGRK